MILSVEDIHTYYGQSHILQGVSLEIDEGEVVALLGRNGAGKTTTVYSIVGFQKPRKGKILYRDWDITNEPPHQITRHGVSLVPQERRLFPNLSVEENLTIGVRNQNGNTKDDRWVLEDVYELFPNLRERKTNHAFELSGGEQQMVAIGRALITDPEILLMDEPSEGLAPQLVDQVEEVIHTLKQDQSLSILLIEQNLPMATRTADRAYVMEKGRITYEGSSDELAESDDILSL